MVRDLSLPDVLKGIVSLVVEFTQCDSCLVYLLDGEDLVLCASNRPHPSTIGKLRMRSNEGLTGWVARERSISRMGGLQYGPRGAVPMTFCKTAAAGTSDAMTISTQFHGTGVTLLRLTRSAGSSACNQSPPNFVATSSSGSLIGTPTSDMAQRMAEMPLASVPPLWSPGDVRVSSQRCRTSNLTTGSQSQSQPLLTEMSMADVLAHYGRQLDSAGWKTAANESESATRTWSKAVPGRGTQEVTIRVSRMALNQRRQPAVCSQRSRKAPLGLSRWNRKSAHSASLSASGSDGKARCACPP